MAQSPWSHAEAAWIWAAAGRFPVAEQVLDNFHASQQIALAAVGLCGEGTAGSTDWLEPGQAPG